MNRLNLILGFSLVFWGVVVTLNPKFYNPIYRRVFDFTGYEIVFGGMLIAVGFLFIWTTLSNKRK